MITLHLKCNYNHKFEGWFNDIIEYTQQCQNGMIECPLCSSPKIHTIRKSDEDFVEEHSDFVTPSFVSYQETLMISEQFKISSEKEILH